jgi:hypothetical protein
MLLGRDDAGRRLAVQQYTQMMIKDVVVIVAFLVSQDRQRSAIVK